MDTIPRAEKVVSVVIPAFNEGERVGNIVRLAITHPLIGEVIVVDDGSHDNTALSARRSGARTVVHSANRGKAAAMETGVQLARHDIVFFIDADIRGLTHSMMSTALRPVIDGNTDMSALVIDRDSYLPRMIARKMPLLSGIRVLRKSVWKCVPPEFRRGFSIETALNFFAKENGFRITHQIVPGLAHVIKEQKRGFAVGFKERAKMIWDISHALVMLHTVRPMFGTTFFVSALSHRKILRLGTRQSTRTGT